jgi:hypothetical protein
MGSLLKEYFPQEKMIMHICCRPLGVPGAKKEEEEEK